MSKPISAFEQWYRNNKYYIPSILTFLFFIGLIALGFYLSDHIQDWKWVK